MRQRYRAAQDAKKEFVFRQQWVAFEKIPNLLKEAVRVTEDADWTFPILGLIRLAGGALRPHDGQMVEARLRGIGCVPIYNLMEDAATSEISRTQV